MQEQEQNQVQWMALVLDRQRRMMRQYEERTLLMHDASGKKVEYFKEKIAATEELEKRVWLVAAALEGEPQVSEWVQKEWVAKTLLANELQGLRICFTYGHYWVRLPLLSKMMQIPEIADHLVECMTDWSICCLQYYQRIMKTKMGRGFTREHCLARNGAVLHQRISRSRKIKTLIKMFGLSKSDLASVGVPWPAK